MRIKRPSLKDIANKLEVSITTVSFVLNGKGKEKKISDDVIKKILKYTEEIDYRPNHVAQSLRTGRTRVLVFMVEDISNHFFSKVARVIEDIAYEKNYKILFCSNENNDERSRELINLFFERQVDGFIIIPSPGIRKEVAMLIKNDIPVVLFDRYFPDLKTNYVVVDNEKATYNGILHLIRGSFRKIGFITVDVEQTQMEDRLLGYKRAVMKHGLKESILKIPYNKRGSIQAKHIFSNFVKENEELDALFFATNYLTQVGLEVLKEQYPSKIHELGMIAFDDNDFFKIHNPSISAVSQPLEMIGKSLMKIILNELGAEVANEDVSQIVLETNLIERNSSGAKTSIQF